MFAPNTWWDTEAPVDATLSINSLQAKMIHQLAPNESEDNMEGKTASIDIHSFWAILHLQNLLIKYRTAVW